MGEVYVIRSEDFLVHHGIKGQRWGIRRFQNYDGTLIGAKRRNKKKVPYEKYKERSKYYQKEFGMSKKQADEAALKRRQLMKKIAIGAGIAVGTSVAIYAASKIGREYMDGVIKSGSTIQTLKMCPDEIDKGKSFYTAYRNGDKLKYVGNFSIGVDEKTLALKNKSKVIMDVQKDIKVAGGRQAKKAYKELLKNKDFSNQVIKDSTGFDWKKVKDLNYKEFNTYGLLGENSTGKAASTFYDTLKKKGYSAVADMNDRTNGFKTKATIIFDKSFLTKDSEGLVKKTIEEVSEGEIAKGLGYSIVSKFGSAVTNPKSVAIGSAVVAGKTLSKYDNEVFLNAKKKKTA